MRKPKAGPPATSSAPRPAVFLAAAGLLAMIAASKLPQLFLSSILVARRLAIPVVPDLSALTAPVAVLRAATLSAALAIGFVFWSSGRAFSRALELETSSRLESSASALALGALLWGQFFFALGLAGFLRPALLRALLIVGAAAGGADCFRRPPDFAAFGRELREAGTSWLALFAVHLAILAPYAFIPETFYDALEYHLAFPGLALLRGRIGPEPMNAFAGLPSLPSMIYGWALAIEAGGRVAHLLNFGFLVATALAVLGLARRLGSPRLGGPAVVLFAAAPCVVMMSVCTGVELAGAFFQAAAIAAILRAVDGERPEPWAAAGLLIGAAMAVKPLAWGLPAAALAAVWVSGKRPEKRNLAWAAAAACAVFVPWLVKNAVFYGNPIYPFLHEYIRPKAEIMPGWRYWSDGVGLPWGSGVFAGLSVWLKAPFEAARYKSDVILYADPVLIGLVPAGLWLSLRERRFKILLGFTAAAWLPVSLVTDLPRYFIPIFPGLSLVAAAAVHSGGRVLRAAVLACLALFMIALWLNILPFEGLRAFTGQQTESDFLAHVHRSYPNPLDAAARWIDGNAPKDARVLVFGDARGFQLTRDYVLCTQRQITPLERWANASADASALSARLAREKVKYILVNHGEIQRLGLTLHFTGAGKSALDRFWARDTRKVFQAGPKRVRLSTGEETLDSWVAVYEVLSEEEAAKPHEADDLFAAYDVNYGTAAARTILSGD